MKLAMETHPLTRFYEEAEGYELVKQAGFDGVDLSFYWGAVKLDDHYQAAARETRRLLDEIGLSCVQAHAPFTNKTTNSGFAYGMKMDVSEPDFLELVRSMEYAAIAGARQIIVHGILVPEGARTAASLDYNYHFYRALAPYAKEFGIKIAIENQIMTAFTNPFMLSEMLRRLDDPDTFCACIDVGHAQLCRVQPQNFIRDMTPGSVQALHIQDNFGSADDHLLPGHGILKWDEIMTSLADVDYQGDFTLELTGYWKAFGAKELPIAMALACAVGRKLMSKMDVS